ncbi:hypothetical protein BGX31_008380 [Mortierella sp. GBA43]|nr:hypothetical protein BGX31_008380 [Mortierella sp. GBA43]
MGEDRGRSRSPTSSSRGRKDNHHDDKDAPKRYGNDRRDARRHSKSRSPYRSNRKQRKHKRSRSRSRSKKSKSKRHRRRSHSSSDDSDGNPRSAITGQKLKLKIAKSSEDKKRDKNRGSLLEFLNASYD